MSALDDGAGVPTVDAGTDEAEALDAYSRVVTRVAEALLPSVASLRVGADGWATGSGSAVVISADGFLVTSAHVVAGAAAGTATFGDGRELPYEVTGIDRLSDLAVVRVSGAGLRPSTWATPTGSGSGSWSSPSGTRWDSPGRSAPASSAPSAGRWPPRAGATPGSTTGASSVTSVILRCAGAPPRHHPAGGSVVVELRGDGVGLDPLAVAEEGDADGPADPFH